jgi:carboxymethylenebutenolidase
MGQFTTIMARDGHEFQAWLAAPPGRPRGAVVVLQEIFGVNSHIRKVTEGFATAGYTAIAPCLFDRVRRGIELTYSAADKELGIGYVKQLPAESTMKDIAAALAVVRHSGGSATVGYCWGGTLSYLAACQLPLSCAVVYYGKLAGYLERQPRCAVMYHFGDADQSIPPDAVAAIRAAQPDAPLYTYPGAGHGFNCDQRDTYDREAAELARSRTLEFLAQHLAAAATGDGATRGASNS